MTAAAIILAAGFSSRMGQPKALLRHGGEAFLDRLIGVFQLGCQPVVAVLGHHADEIRQSLQRGNQAILAYNADYASGMLSSLQCGLRTLPLQTTHVLFTPVDQPGLQMATLQGLLAAAQDSGAPLVLPRFAGRRGHPVCCTRAVAEELLALPVTAQARDVIVRHEQQAHYLDVEDASVLHDVDTPAEYREYEARLALRVGP